MRRFAQNSINPKFINCQMYYIQEILLWVIRMKKESGSVKNMQKKSGKELVSRLVIISLILVLLLMFPAGSIWGSVDDAMNIDEIIGNAKAWENIGLSYLVAGEWESAAGAYMKAASHWERLDWSMAAETWKVAACLWSIAAMEFQDLETYRDVVSYSEKRDREAEAWEKAASFWKKAGEWRLAAQAYENAASYWNNTILRMRAINLWREAASCWMKTAKEWEGLNWSKSAEAWQGAARCLRQVFEWELAALADENVALCWAFAALADENVALCWAFAGEPGKESEAWGNASFCRNETKI
jgi:hypothetical protein